MRLPGCAHCSCIQDSDRYVSLPRLSRHTVGDLESPAFEFALGCIHQPVVLTLPMHGLSVDHHDPQLTRLESATRLHGRDELLLMEVAVAECPADGIGGDRFALDSGVFPLPAYRDGTV